MSEWIPVKDRLPNNEQQDVIIVVSGPFGKFVDIACWSKTEEAEDSYRFISPISIHESAIRVNVEYWMPLPAPPSNAI